MILLRFVRGKLTALSILNVNISESLLSLSSSNGSFSYFCMDPTTNVVRHSFYSFSPVNFQAYLGFSVRTPGLKFKEFVGYNNINTNSYLISNNSHCIFQEQNFTSVAYIEYFAAAVKIQAVFGNSVNIFY